MEIDSDILDLQIQINVIQNLFFNKQLDQFVQRVQKHILPLLDQNLHHQKPSQKKQNVNYLKKIQETQLTKEKIYQNKTNTQQQLNNEINNKQYTPKQAETKQIKTEKAQTQIQNKTEIFQQATNKQNPKNQNHKQNQSIPLSPQAIQQSTNKNKQQPKLPLKNRINVKEFLHTHSKINIVQKYQQMKLILYKLQKEMEKIQTPMNQANQWKINKINDWSKVACRTKGTIIQLRYQGLIEMNIENLCIMIYLTQLYKQWVPFCTSSKTYCQPSPLQKILLVDLKIPFLTQRYAYFHGMAIDRITKNGKLYIYGQAISHQKQLLTKVYKAPQDQYEKKVAKSVVLDAKFFICQISNQGKGKYGVRMYGVLDSHMPLLPQKIVNYIVKQMGGMVLDKIIKKANNFKNTPWQKQLKQNQKRQVKNKFYDWLHDRISKWEELKKKPTKEELAKTSKI